MKRFYLIIAVVCVGLWSCEKEENRQSTEVPFVDPVMAFYDQLIEEQGGMYDDAEFMDALCDVAILIDMKDELPYKLIDDKWQPCDMNDLLLGVWDIAWIVFEDGVIRRYSEDSASPTNPPTIVYGDYHYVYDAENNTIAWSYGDEYLGESKVQYFKDNKVIIDGYFPCVFEHLYCRYSLILDKAEREKLLGE